MTTRAPDTISIRPLSERDLPAALAIQAAAYPAFLRETADAFASRIALPASYCLAAEREGGLIAYLLAHGWQRDAPPAVGAMLDPGTPREILYIHDLAVSAAGQGSGVGRRLIAQAFAAAARDGLAEVQLIAVEGADSYWRAQGFAEAEMGSSLAAKIAGYGADARWMTRRIDAR